MKIFKKLLVISAVLGVIGVTPFAFAQNNLPDVTPTKADVAKAAFKEDAKCTKCHDESENAPILSIYQTKHGVKGDDRTPKCTSCHGQSDKHLAGDKDGKGRPKLSAEERRQIRDEVKEALLAAAQAVGAGNLPAGVKRLVKDITEPMIGWRELLEQQIQSTIKSDFTWARPSRRGWHMDAIMPGLKSEDALDVFVFLDMSGSISELQARDFIAEIGGMMSQYSDYRIHIACFDTEVYNHRIYTADSAEEISEYELAGGGGTMFECMFEFLKDNDIQPDKLVVFTDGYPCGSWGDPNWCDTVWIIHGDRNPNPPFGIWALYEQAA